MDNIPRHPLQHSLVGLSKPAIETNTKMIDYLDDGRTNGRLPKQLDVNYSPLDLARNVFGHHA